MAAVDFLQLTEDIALLKSNLKDMEKSNKRLESLVSQHSKTLTELINKIIAVNGLGNDNVTIGNNNGGISPGQVLAELAAAIARASKRNL